MSSERADLDERDFQASLDGRLSPERAAAVEAYLAAHPDEKARYERDAELRRALRAAWAAELDEPVPSGLRVARLSAERRRRQYWQVGAIAAALVLFVLGGIGGWTARNAGLGLMSSTRSARAATEREITADALAAHRVFSVEVRHPVEVDAAQQAHLVQWLSRRLGHPLRVPDLNAAGFQLMGGRLLPSEDGPAAQFMYQNGNTRLTLYERADSAGETAFRYTEQNGIGLFYWSDQDFGYALAGKLGREQLLKIAELVYHQLSSEGAKPPTAGKAS
jgi:anti-sigma factor RsiW